MTRQKLSGWQAKRRKDRQGVMLKARLIHACERFGKALVRTIQRASLICLTLGFAIVLSGCTSREHLSTPPPMGRPQNFHRSDAFTPAETFAASSAIILGTVNEVRPANWENFLYRTTVDKVLFSLQPDRLSGTITVLGNVILPLRSGDVVLLALSRSTGDASDFFTTTRLSGIGFPQQNYVAFRSPHGNLVTYPKSPASRIGCFLSSNPSTCRATLLADFGIRSAKQRNVYDQMLVREPGGGVAWIYAYRATHRTFPNQICSRRSTGYCASRAAFEEAAHIGFTM